MDSKTPKCVKHPNIGWHWSYHHNGGEKGYENWTQVCNVCYDAIGVKVYERPYDACSENSKPLQLPGKLADAVEGLIRIATDEKYAIIGLVFKADPPSITVIRNVTGGAAELFHKAGDLVQQKIEDGLVVEQQILPLN